MAMVDDKLTKKIQDWLDTPAEERDVQAGAAMLLSLNRNRVLHQNILRRPDKMAPKLEYELKKHLRIRLDGLTRRDVVRMSAVVVPAVERTLEEFSPVREAEHKGKRADHDSLPGSVRALYDGQTVLYHRIKEVYNTLMGMKDAPACDRYEHLKILKGLDDNFRQNWQRYDEAEPLKEGEEDIPAEAAPEEGEGASEEGEPALPSAKDVAAARKFISSNLKALDALEDEKRQQVLASIQERVELVVRSGGSFKPDFRDKLISIGVVF